MQCDAMVCLMSAAEVTRLTRMGKFDMSAPTTGPMAFLKKLRGKSSADVSTSAEDKTTAGARQMRMLRRLPKILRFIPGTAQDVRAYFLTMQYWLAGSEQNMFNLVQFLVDRYADGPRRSLRGTLKPAAPLEYPEVGVYHPRMAQRMSAELATCRAWPPAARTAPWACWSCARTCWRATPATTTA
jgi:magnesium chelatase subunit H